MGALYNILSNITFNNILIGLLSLTCIYLIHFYYKHFTRVNPIPGPIPIPLIGNLAVFTSDIDAWFWRLNKKYGHHGIFEVNIAGHRQIVITRAEYLETLMTADNRAHFMRSPQSGLFGLFDFEKKGLALNDDYNYWKFNRYIFTHAITVLTQTDKPSILLNQLFEEMEQYWIDLKQPGEREAVIDIAAWMRHLTMDGIAMLTAGKQLSAMKNYYQKLKNEPLTKEMFDTEEFVKCMNTFVMDNKLLFVPKILRNFPLIKPRVDELLKNCNRLYEKLVNVVKEKRKEVEKTIMHGELNTEEMNLLTSLIIANTEHDPHPQKNVDPSLARPMTDDEIRGVMFDAFAADDPYRPITSEDLAKLKYVEAIIKETSRIRPVVIVLSRYSERPDKVAGYMWPSKTYFIMYVRGISNSPLYWKDPDKFIPERFYGNQEIYKNSFSMFGGGPRICPGNKFAMIELKTLLAAVYRRFDVELLDIHAPLNLRTSMITMVELFGIQEQFITKCLHPGDLRNLDLLNFWS
ncbi:9024_t:CDS:2 [Paraglomus occultum]|uniref:9024_t:CDS:1 n=1 Tax=Paraglomus occultum TaxID=144539 RepID=A0A9N9FBW1_9GLOM|nr:9024_t:CDS:2 [Paraglomus occultum]